MAAVRGFDERDAGVGGDDGAAGGRDADEGVVERVEDERGDGDAGEDAGGGGAEVVVLRALEAGVEGGDALVEVAQGAQAVGAGGVVNVGEEHGLAAEVAGEGAEEVALVDAVGGAVEGVGGGAEIERGGDGGDGAEHCGLGAGAELAGELEHEIAAHRVADERDAAQAEAGGERAHDRGDIAREAGVVERGREGFGAAAVAHVHADDVEAGAPHLVGVADDVLRLRRAFEAVEDDDGEARGADLLGLPVAVAEDLAGDLVARGGGDFDELGGEGRQVVAAAEIVAEDGLEMAVREPGARVEGRGSEGLQGHPAGLAGWGGARPRRKAWALRAPVGSSSCLK